MKETQEELEFLLREKFSPTALEVVDFSVEHAGHSGNPEGRRKGTHLRVRIACESFRGKSLLEQHRLVVSTLESTVKTRKIHALEIRTEVP